MYEDISNPTSHNVTIGLGWGDQAQLAEMNKGITPVFMIHTEVNPAKSEIEGRPIFDEIEIVKILVAGDQFNQVAHPVDATIKARFPTQYAAWKANHQAEHVSGTPLEAWSLLAPHQIAELRAINVRNVEGLADIADTNLSRSPGLRDLRAKAQAWLRDAKSGGELARVVGENSRMKDDMEAMREQMEEMARTIKSLQSTSAKSAKAA